MSDSAGFDPDQHDADARSTVRLENALLVSYTISEEFKPEHTETYDIGPGGLAMLTNVQLPNDMAVILELELRGDDRPKLRLNARVRWSTPDPFLGKFRTGVAFTERTEDQDRELLRYIDTIYRLRDLGVLR